MSGWKEKLASLYLLLGIVYGPCAVALYITANGYGMVSGIGGIFACGAYVAAIYFNEKLKTSLPVGDLPKKVVNQVFSSALLFLLFILSGLAGYPKMRMAEFVILIVWIVFIGYIKVSTIMSRGP